MERREGGKQQITGKTDTGEKRKKNSWHRLHETMILSGGYGWIDIPRCQETRTNVLQTDMFFRFML